MASENTEAATAIENTLPIGYIVDRDQSDIELLLHLFDEQILAWRWSSNHHLHLIVDDFDLAKALSDPDWFQHCLGRDSWNLAAENSFFCENCQKIVTTRAGPWNVRILRGRDFYKNVAENLVEELKSCPCHA